MHERTRPEEVATLKRESPSQACKELVFCPHIPGSINDLGNGE